MHHALFLLHVVSRNFTNITKIIHLPVTIVYTLHLAHWNHSLLSIKIKIKNRSFSTLFLNAFEKKFPSSRKAYYSELPMGWHKWQLLFLYDICYCSLFHNCNICYLSDGAPGFKHKRNARIHYCPTLRLLFWDCMSFYNKNM